jgi:hypothetical protein
LQDELGLIRDTITIAQKAHEKETNTFNAQQQNLPVCLKESEEDFEHSLLDSWLRFPFFLVIRDVDLAVRFKSELHFMTDFN